MRLPFECGEVQQFSVYQNTTTKGQQNHRVHCYIRVTDIKRSFRFHVYVHYELHPKYDAFHSCHPSLHSHVLECVHTHTLSRSFSLAFCCAKIQAQVILGKWPRMFSSLKIQIEKRKTIIFRKTFSIKTLVHNAISFDMAACLLCNVR